MTKQMPHMRNHRRRKTTKNRGTAWEQSEKLLGTRCGDGWGGGEGGGGRGGRGVGLGANNTNRKKLDRKQSG